MTIRTLVAAALVACLLMHPVAAGAHEGGDDGCDGETRAVLGDSADWAAVELVAWVLGAGCLLDSGDRRSGQLPDATAEQYDGQAVIVVGGPAAVPGAKLAGLDVEQRLWGADRLETMRAVVEWADRESGADAGPTRTVPQGFANLACYASGERENGYGTVVVEFDYSPAEDVASLYFEARLLQGGREVEWANKRDDSPPPKGQIEHYVLRGYTNANWDECSVSVE